MPDPTPRIPAPSFPHELSGIDKFAVEIIPPPPIELLGILKSHLDGLCTQGRSARALLISEVEAGRCGIAHGTRIMGLPIKLTARIPLGRAYLELDQWSEYEFALPLYFTED